MLGLFIIDVAAEPIALRRVALRMKRRPQYRPELDGLDPRILLGAPIVVITLLMVLIRTLV